MKIIKILFLLLLIFVCACNHSSGDRIKNVNRPGRDEMTGLNTYLVQKDREIILNYIERKHLDMKESSTGLWFMIKEPGSGDFFSDNDKIILNYECELLDGTVCYSSATLGAKEVVLGRSELESGLNEGLRMLKPGAEAVFILPPFLGHGLVGDGNRIPPRATIIYNVSIPK